MVDHEECTRLLKRMAQANDGRMRLRVFGGEGSDPDMPRLRHCLEILEDQGLVMTVMFVESRLENIYRITHEGYEYIKRTESAIKTHTKGKGGS